MNLYQEPVFFVAVCFAFGVLATVVGVWCTWFGVVMVEAVYLVVSSLFERRQKP